MKALGAATEVGMVIAAQGALVGEKQLGTALPLYRRANPRTFLPASASITS